MVLGGVLVVMFGLCGSWLFLDVLMVLLVLNTFCWIYSCEASIWASVPPTEENMLLFKNVYLSFDTAVHRVTKICQFLR